MTNEAKLREQLQDLQEHASETGRVTISVVMIEHWLALLAASPSEGEKCEFIQHIEAMAQLLADAKGFLEGRPNYYEVGSDLWTWRHRVDMEKEMRDRLPAAATQPRELSERKAWKDDFADRGAGAARRERERMSYEIENWLYVKLGGEWCGNVCPPADMETLRWTEMGCERVASITNDGFELSIGRPDEWWGSIRREHAHRLAWFILWHWWIRWEWFGLRRAIWYWLLHRRCERNNKIGKMFMERERAGKGS